MENDEIKIMSAIFLFTILIIVTIFGYFLDLKKDEIIIQPNITILMPQENKISDEVKISAMISSEFLERNDIQHYNTEKQSSCISKYENDKFIDILDFTGSSMNPTLWEGNKLICDFGISDYKSGMIIAFHQDNQLKVHRIKAIYNDYVITQGDNNQDDDGRINNENIQCVVIGVCY